MVLRVVICVLYLRSFSSLFSRFIINLFLFQGFGDVKLFYVLRSIRSLSSLRSILFYFFLDVNVWYEFNGFQGIYGLYFSSVCVLRRSETSNRDTTP